jgi:hypothetical protein
MTATLDSVTTKKQPAEASAEAEAARELVRLGGGYAAGGWGRGGSRRCGGGRLGLLPLALPRAPARSAAAVPLPRTRRQAIPAVTTPGDRASKGGRAALLAPGIVSPRKDHRQERSLRSRTPDDVTRHS